MRPQQQNRRMRGRGSNNNNRKGPNPLTRSYESNGPDVKIRGTAQQVADKYTSLARDAQSSGDRVIAENYLQHAEHYNRLIAAAQAQVQAQQPQQNTRDNRDDDEDERDDRQDRQDDGETQRSSSSQRQQVDDGSGPQPVLEGVPAEVALKDRRNGRGNRAKANGAAEAGEKAASGKDERASEATDTDTDAPAPAPKPRRTRRPRAKASEEDKADSGEASEKPTEEAVTQG